MEVDSDSVLKKISKPIPENIRDFIKYDESSVSYISWIKEIPRSRHKVGDSAGSIDSKGRFVLKFNKSLYKVHRIIWYLCNGDIPDGYEIDHCDNNPSNNCISNLRLAKSSENSWNRSCVSNKTSDLPKGVSFAKARGTKEGYMVAVVYKNGRRYTKGGYNLELLTDWLCHKRLELHKEFSNNG